MPLKKGIARATILNAPVISTGFVIILLKKINKYAITHLQ